MPGVRAAPSGAAWSVMTRHGTSCRSAARSGTTGDPEVADAQGPRCAFALVSRLLHPVVMSTLAPRILCIDDEPEVLQILREYLTEHAFSVRTAMNGRDALAEAKRWTPRAVIVDLVMPRLGGLATIEQMREINPAVAVILMSGRADVLETASTPADVIGVFPKPLDLSGIHASLRRAGIDAARPASHVAGRASARGGRRRILIVDDEVDVREVLAEYLEQRGFEVLRVGSGEEALEGVRREPPEIVLLDIAMPGLSGVDTLRGIRAASADTRVIMVSGIHDVETARRTLALGAADYVPKPVDFGYLDAVLATASPA
jgi:DNA-binding response OmpR family regulator